MLIILQYVRFVYAIIHRDVATDGLALQEIGITYLVNASMGNKPNQTDTNEAFYKELAIEFHGIPALDTFSFNLSPYFAASSEFIHEALKKEGKLRSNDYYSIFPLLSGNKSSSNVSTNNKPWLAPRCGRKI